MAVINAAQYGELRDIVYRPGSGKEELKAHATLPNQAQFTACFQVLEDFWENNRATVKTSMDAALGFTTTAAEAKKIALAWLTWKVSKGG